MNTNDTLGINVATGEENLEMKEWYYKCKNKQTQNKTIFFLCFLSGCCNKKKIEKKNKRTKKTDVLNLKICMLFFFVFKTKYRLESKGLLEFYDSLLRMKLDVSTLIESNENDLRELCDEMCLGASQRMRLLRAIDNKRTMVKQGESENITNNDNDNDNENNINDNNIAYADGKTYTHKKIKQNTNTDTKFL